MVETDTKKKVSEGRGIRKYIQQSLQNGRLDNHEH
jgi:hypothetical protein